MKKFAATLYVLATTILGGCQQAPSEALTINNDIMEPELYDLIKTIPETFQDGNINCIEFQYWFTIFVFDEDGNYIRAANIASDWEFSNFLGNLKESERISLSYPIIGTFKDGEQIELNSNEELKDILDQCLLDDQIQQCNWALSQTACFWDVQNLEDENDPYNGSRFKISKNGVTRFIMANSVYLGGWTTFYIGEQLHINIYLNDENNVGMDWNLDWKLDYRTNNLMAIDNGATTYTLTRQCSVSCTNLVFQQCELDDNPGTALFHLNDYLVCLPADYLDLEKTTYSYFESEQDAVENMNAITNTSYTNTTNPQVLFYRMSAAASGELLHLSTFTLEAIDCD